MVEQAATEGGGNKQRKMDVSAAWLNAFERNFAFVQLDTRLHLSFKAFMNEF